METIVVVVHVLLSVALIGLVLIQQGKGADAGASFGGGASATVFGSRGSAGFLTRTTTLIVIAFFATSIALFVFAANRDTAPSSVTETVVPAVEENTASDIPTND